jgi:hypothetical protein
MRVCIRVGLGDEKYLYHGRVIDIKSIKGKNINITRHLIEDVNGSLIKVDLEDIKFTDTDVSIFNRK